MEKEKEKENASVDVSEMVDAMMDDLSHHKEKKVKNNKDKESKSVKSKSKSNNTHKKVFKKKKEGKKTEKGKNLNLVYEIWFKVCKTEIARLKYSVIQKNHFLMADTASEGLFEVIKEHIKLRDVNKHDKNFNLTFGRLARWS